jgi:hypothetical protein
MKKVLLIDLDPATVADLHAALARQCEFWSVRDFATAEEVLDAVAVDCVVLGLRSDLPAKKKAQLPEALRRFFCPAPQRQSALVFSPRLIQDGNARGRLEAASEVVVSDLSAERLRPVIMDSVAS